MLTALLWFALSPALAAAPAALPPSCWLQDAAQVADSTTLLLCDQGMILAGRAGGPWTALRLPENQNLRAMHFMDRERGLVAGDRGLVLLTEDGGRSWRRVATGTEQNLTAVFALGEDIWIGSSGGLILHSADGGKSWSRQPTYTNLPVESIFFLDRNRGWAVGWSGLVLLTRDGGQSWRQASLPGVWERLSSVYFEDPDNGWACGMYGLLLRTTDGGESWQRVEVPVKSWITSIVVDSQGVVWASAEYSLLSSADRGAHWKVEPVNTLAALSRLVRSEGGIMAFGPGLVMIRRQSSDGWSRLEIEEILRNAALGKPREAEQRLHS